ncbi:hypothetical protein LPMP_260370 [Leishmania panamensis]|uniref:Uncharacterized protein n=1 Tax=Leishmania panamensis TaxID=5679 RepID=A0A088SBV9_LEIPA|nr:hypothetical protein LPMP_260370 [Leishmania panamensis]AIN99151.1 hypothetical protein LPMP_260370 [Leishmania panamensis]
MSVKTTHTTKGLVEAARTYLTEGTFAPDKAADLLQAAIQQDPTYANALVLRSSLAARLGHLTSALADMSLAIEMDKGNTDPHRLAFLYGGRANLCYRMGRYVDAVTDLRSALRWEPDNGMWCYELACVHMKQRSVNLAQWCLQQTLQEPMWSRVNEATRPKVYALYGRSCLTSREYKKARMLLHKSVEAGGEEPAAVLHDMGLAHYFEGTSLATAVEYLTRATEVDTRPLEYPMHLSLALVRSDRYVDALSSMNEAVLRGPEEGCLRFYRGCIELQLGMGPQAIMDLQASTVMGATRQVRAEKTPQKTAAHTSVALGLAYIFCGKDLSSAVASLEAEALRQTPEVSTRLYGRLLLGIVRHEAGERHAALRALQSALQVLRETLRTHHSSGSGEEARSHTSELPICVADVEMLTLTHLGLVYSDCGYTDLAARHFCEARQRAIQQHRDAAQKDLCDFRLAVSQVEMKDNLGALQTLRSRPFSRGESPITSAAPPSPPKANSAPTEVTDVEPLSAKSPTEHVKRKQLTVPSIRAFNTVSQCLSPGEVEHLHAVILRRLGRLELALSCATAAIEAQQRVTGGASATTSLAGGRAVPAFHYNRALIFFSLACYAEALVDVQECIQACSEDERAIPLGVEAADPYYLQGCIQHSLGAHGDALDSLTEALRINPSLQRIPPFDYAYGVLLAIAGRLGEALSAFTAAITTHNEEVAASVAGPGQQHQYSSGNVECAPLVYHHERAKVYQQLGNYEDALKDYNVVLRCTSGSPLTAPLEVGTSIMARPSSWGALVNRALTLKELKRYDEAAVDWDAALRSDRSGLLASLTSHDVYELPYLHLCLPGAELTASAR